MSCVLYWKYELKKIIQSHNKLCLTDELTCPDRSGDEGSRSPSILHCFAQYRQDRPTLRVKGTCRWTPVFSNQYSVPLALLLNLTQSPFHPVTPSQCRQSGSCPERNRRRAGVRLLSVPITTSNISIIQMWSIKNVIFSAGTHWKRILSFLRIPKVEHRVDPHEKFLVIPKAP